MIRLVFPSFPQTISHFSWQISLLKKTWIFPFTELLLLTYHSLLLKKFPNSQLLLLLQLLLTLHSLLLKPLSSRSQLPVNNHHRHWQHLKFYQHHMIKHNLKFQFREVEVRTGAGNLACKLGSHLFDGHIHCKWLPERWSPSL